MLTQLLLLVLEAAFGFFVFLLLVRFYMQWLRVSFRNQVGQFVVALTDWLVRPARRIVPGLFGIDLPSFLLAWFLHASYLGLAFWLKGFSFGAHPGAAAGIVLSIALIELARFSVYLLIGVVLFAAVLSWVNPHAPMAPLLNALARPFLRPFQRVVPPIANVDLSPLLLLLALQIALLLIGWLRASIVPFIA